jgi:type IV pilus assembly protein PilE
LETEELRQAMRKHSRGVTLIELMTVMVIAAILASIAVPTYRSYVLRTHRTTATAALLRVQQAQEKFFLSKNVYSTNLTAAVADGGLGIPAVTDNGEFYDLTLDPATPTAYTVHAKARAVTKQTDDTRCAEFTINQDGKRTATSSTGTDTTAECWR